MNVINVLPGQFGGPMRAGDLVALCNAIEYVRIVLKDPDVSFCLTDGSVFTNDNVIKTYNFINDRTDYFSDMPGNKIIPWKNVNLWDLRDISGDLVNIPNVTDMEEVSAIFPVIDAPYNTYRNWTKETIEYTLKYFREDNTPKKFICGTEQVLDIIKNNYDTSGYELSSDIDYNLHLLAACKNYCGGDTGMSHLISALDDGPQGLYYMYSSRGLLHTLPFFLFPNPKKRSKGILIKYWGDFEGTIWDEK